MKADPKSTSRANEAARKKAREDLMKKVSGMGLAEMLKLLRESFKCTNEKGGKAKKKESITGSKSFFGKTHISNNCQFQPTTSVGLKHITGFCCNDYYELCPLYQFYACSSALMSSIRNQ